MLAQVTAAIMAAIWAEGGHDIGTMDLRGTGKAAEKQRAYSEYQLAKLKGFCCVWTNADLPEIWDYFKSTKEVDAQRTQLLEEMKK